MNGRFLLFLSGLFFSVSAFADTPPLNIDPATQIFSALLSALAPIGGMMILALSVGIALKKVAKYLGVDPPSARGFSSRYQRRSPYGGGRRGRSGGSAPRSHYYPSGRLTPSGAEFYGIDYDQYMLDLHRDREFARQSRVAAYHHDYDKFVVPEVFQHPVVKGSASDPYSIF